MGPQGAHSSAWCGDKTKRSQNPSTPTLRFHNSLEQLTGLRKTFTGSLLRILWKIQMNTQRERHLDKVWKGPECRSFCPQGVGVPHPHPGPWMCSIHKLSEPCYLGVLEVLLSRQDWLNYWPLMIDWLSRPSSHPAGGGWGWKFGASGHQPPSCSRQAPFTHPSSVKKTLYPSAEYKVFETLLWGPGMKTK